RQPRHAAPVPSRDQRRQPPAGARHLAARPARDPVAAPASGGALETPEVRMELAARRGGPRMKPDELQTVLERLSRPRVLVIGDLILDCYVSGEVERISPEA